METYKNCDTCPLKVGKQLDEAIQNDGRTYMKYWDSLR